MVVSFKRVRPGSLLRPLDRHDPDQVLRQIATDYSFGNPRVDLKDFRDDPDHSPCRSGARTSTLCFIFFFIFGDAELMPTVSLIVAVTDLGGCAETRPKK